MDKMPIAIKFCGGCNPKYDRGVFITRLKQVLGDRCEWVSYDHPSPAGIIIVCGCERACVTKSFNTDDYPCVLIVDRTEQLEEMVTALLRIMDTDTANAHRRDITAIA